MVKTTMLTTPLTDMELAAVSDYLRRGGVIVAPSETVYGLSAMAGNYKASRQIRKLKRRHLQSPFIVLMESIEQVYEWIAPPGPETKELMKVFWPGPLTLVLSQKEQGDPLCTGRRDTIGVRVSPDPVCSLLLNRTGMPLLSTSANPAGREPALTAESAEKYFRDKVGFIINDGARSRRPPSTVIEMTGRSPLVLREGAVPSAKIFAVLGK